MTCLDNDSRKYDIKGKISSKKFWQNGASTILFYICLMWLIAMAFIFFVELYAAFSGSGKTQLYADILADGSAYAGNNGWGLDINEADATFSTLVSLNESDLTNNVFDNVANVSIDYSFTDSDGSDSGAESSKVNTANSSVEWISTLLTDDSESLGAASTASTRVTYAGGMEIVLEAWHHTYQYWKNEPNPEDYQTWYVWGGGHGSDTEWTQYADCSGFVSGVYRECGYDVPNWHTTYTMVTLGKLVAEGTGADVFKNAQPGDIILYWYSSSSQPQHVGIYAGEYNGEPWMIHSSGGSSNSYSNPNKGESGGAILAQINTSRYSNIMIRRIVDDSAQAYQGSEVSITGLSDYETTIYLELSSLGYTDIAIAAMLGNFYQESNNIPIMIQGYSGNLSYCQQYADNVQQGLVSEYQFVTQEYRVGYGLAQWTYSRKQDLWDWTNGNVSDTYSQISFLDHELSTTYSKVKTEINNTNSLSYATEYFFNRFESPYDSSLSTRQNAAEKYYTAIQNYTRAQNREATSETAEA